MIRHDTEDQRELAELGNGGGLFFLRSWCVTGPLMKLEGEGWRY